MIHTLYICLGLMLFSTQASSEEIAHSIDESSVEYDAPLKKEKEAKTSKENPGSEKHLPFHLGIKRDKALPELSINVYLLWKDGHIERSLPTMHSSHEGHLVYPTLMGSSSNRPEGTIEEVIVHVKSKKKPTKFLAIEQFSIPKDRKLTLHLARSSRGEIALSEVPS